MKDEDIGCYQLYLLLTKSTYPCEKYSKLIMVNWAFNYVITKIL